MTGQLEVADTGWGSPNGKFLADLSDAHPDFAAHIVKAVNSYSAIQKVLEIQGASGPLATTLRDVLPA